MEQIIPRLTADFNHREALVSYQWAIWRDPYGVQALAYHQILVVNYRGGDNGQGNDRQDMSRDLPLNLALRRVISRLEIDSMTLITTLKII